MKKFIMITDRLKMETNDKNANSAYTLEGETGRLKMSSF